MSGGLIVVVIVVRGPFVLPRRLSPASSLSGGPCHPSPTSSLLSAGRLSCGGLVVHPPHRRRRPWASCPVEASSPSLSGGPCRPSPTSSSSLSTSLVAIVVQWGPRRPSPTVIVVVAVWWGFIGRSPRHCCQLSPTSSSVGHLTCGGLVVVIVRWGPCHPFPMLLSPAIPHSVVVIVVHGPFDLQRPCCRHCPVGCLVVRSPRRRHQPSPTLSSLSSSTGHLTCGGLVVVVVHGPFDLRRPCHCRCPVGCLVVHSSRRRHQPSPTSSSSSSSSVGHLPCGGLVLVIIWWGPRPRPHHPQAICPVEASSPLLSDGGLLLLLLIIRSSFLLQGPRPRRCRCQSSPHRRCPVGASPSSSVLADCPCRIIVIVVIR